MLVLKILWLPISACTIIIEPTRGLILTNTLRIFELGKTYTLTYAPADDQKTSIALIDPESGGRTILTSNATGGQFAWHVNELLTPGDGYHIGLRQGEEISAGVLFGVTIVPTGSIDDSAMFTQTISPQTAGGSSGSLTTSTAVNANLNSPSLMPTTLFTRETPAMVLTSAQPSQSWLNSPSSPTTSQSNSLSVNSALSTKVKVGVAIGAVSGALILATIAFFFGMKFKQVSTTMKKISRLYEPKPELDGKPINEPVELPADGPGSSNEPQELPVVESPAEIGRQSAYTNSTIIEALGLIDSIFGNRALDLESPSARDTGHKASYSQTALAPLSPISPL
ncbi:uncharacterized protein BDR25DRAFT_312501 [Lindgomyces ingoldianus]|uniref:Uncharacterized protein n=1 Tax=Lindgomyces ingoldianus TaxID=673940 RepID=A0ACB6R562_9PLEO|nr:uncharacterized protein BDR25DRAFT_312501 [Lindgomyces ingoldianus]KAF2473437.1 hypothetical protein BDR25DRAFT_312501 [Lindgomyces ingoldianus]